jgi:uncharacterized protein YqjF (DUF2071 family)
MERTFTSSTSHHLRYACTNGTRRHLVPSSLQIDTFDSSAWVGVVPFRMSGIRARGMPPIPGTSAFPELNLRTYVTCEGKPGVWFFSLDATSALAVAATRRFFYLPYFRAQMALATKDDGTIDYRSRRTHRGAPPADLRVAYKPTGEVFTATPGSLDYSLTERYCLYAARGNEIHRCEIDHTPWPLQRAEVQIKFNTMAAASAVVLPNEKPLLHFARFQDVRVWKLEKMRF